MKTKLSLKASVAKGALAVYLKPRLAMDAKIDLNYLLKGVTSKTWATDKPKLAADIKAKVAGKLAKDANIEDLAELLNSLDGDEPGEMTESGEAPPNLGADDGEEAMKAFLKSKGLSDEEIRIVEAATA